MIARNRAVYDVLVLLLCYPEKRTSDLEGVISVHVDEDDEDSDSTSELQESYNVGNGRGSLPDLLRSASKTHHAAAPTAHHPLDHRGNHVPLRSSLNPSNQDTDREASDLLCMLLCDMLYKYSYNEKYITLIRVWLSSFSHSGTPERPADPLHHDVSQGFAKSLHLQAPRSSLSMSLPHSKSCTSSLSPKSPWRPTTTFALDSWSTTT